MPVNSRQIELAKLNLSVVIIYFGLFYCPVFVRFNAHWITLSVFYRAVNGIFGRIGRMASEEVILEQIKTKCLPILLYGLEVSPLSKTNLRSLDFPINRFFTKLFNTSNMQTATECQSIFDFRLPSVIIPDRCKTFRIKYETCNCYTSYTRYTSLPCPRCKICCFCIVNAL